ncbi:hypothetical protein [Arthrobacter sp. QXT-31]|uniref:hypothetical protein n=1 Tax=Arthrobacter sp. QXT-31 TaxID=1357915 RepID=UPI0009719195|nr:hypothetical protein [Arthrobacter sp. QXT-31]APX03374.1 hypothetical protein BWQ92_18085 [Arthrobacter sp. QXT-31]
MWNMVKSQALELWPDAEHIDDATYFDIMEAANALCVAYAPSLPEGAEIPKAWYLAEILMARDLWSKMSGGNNEQIGPDGYAIRPANLEWQARNLLRPKTSPLKRLR